MDSSQISNLHFIHEQLPQRVVFGPGAIRDLPKEVDRLGGNRFLVISSSSTELIAERLVQSLGPSRVVAIIKDARQHTPSHDVDVATRVVAANRVDAVITIGGGSSIGLGKAVSAPELHLIAVPTTYAGSECTPLVGVTRDGRKAVTRDPSALPRLVVYDPDLTISLPTHVSVASGLNAMAHCVEALYSKQSTPATTLLGEEAFRSFVESIPRIIKNPTDRDSRSIALYAAHLAGNALAAATMGLHHRICHVLGGSLGLNHAATHAVVLPHVMAFNEEAAAIPLRRIAKMLGNRRSPAALQQLVSDWGGPTTLAELGIRSEQVDMIANAVIEEPVHNPRPVTRASLIELLQGALEGRPLQSAS